MMKLQARAVDFQPKGWTRLWTHEQMTLVQTRLAHSWLAHREIHDQFWRIFEFRGYLRRRTFQLQPTTANMSDSGEVEVETSGYQVLPKEVTDEIGSIKLFNKW